MFKTSPKLLIIAYPFPPVPYSGTYRIIRLCKGLDKLGAQVHVLSIKIDDRIPNDENLLLKIPGSISVHRTAIIDPWLSYQKWKQKNDKNPVSRMINKIVSLLLRLITIPDHQLLWIPFAFSKALKIIKAHSIKNVLISSPPVSSLLTGCLLKKFADVNFIADLRDPIIGNIAQVNLIKPKGLFNKFEKKVLAYIERIVVHSASTVITNTQTHNREMKEKFKSDKFITIRNTFDRDDYKGTQTVKFDKFTIAHLGAIYGLRKADILFKAVKKLEQQISPEALNFQILFVGSNDDQLKQDVNDIGVEKYVNLISRVPHSEAMNIMMKSHMLLLVKATGKGSYGQIPAKFFEYLGTGNHILCLGPEKSEVAEIINELNAGCIVENNENKLFENLKELYSAYQAGRDVTINHPDIQSFSSDHMAERIIPLIV